MVQPLLESITDMLIMEVQKTFDFFRETYPTEKITSGSDQRRHIQHVGLAERIQATFGYPTQVLNPFKIDHGVIQSRWRKSNIPRAGIGRGRWFGIKGSLTMIKVNLIGDQPKRKAKAAVKTGTAHQLHANLSFC